MASAGTAVAITIATLVVAGCAGREVRAPAPAPPAEGAYLVSPLLGYPLDPGAAAAQRLQELHGDLVAGRLGPQAVTAAAQELLAATEGLAAARLLAAEAALVGGDYRSAYDEAAAAAVRHPGYTAAELVAGRAAELAGDVAGAYGHYLAASAVRLAGERAAILRPRAIEIVANRVADAVARGRLGRGEEELGRLQSWAPGETVTLEAQLALAAASGDQGRELDALRGLTAEPASVPERAIRRARLELEVGDPGAGLEILETLARQRPNDALLRDELQSAKFRFRLQNLPEAVQGSARSPELTRGQWAVLLYWLVPGVRAAEVSSARIAIDALDHPHRQEIIRVVNLGLMEVDPGLRQFSPQRPVRRVRALRSLLRLLQRRQPTPACVEPLAGNPTPSNEAICATAAACGLLAGVGDCLPDAGVSGSEGLDWIRRTVTD